MFNLKEAKYLLWVFVLLGSLAFYSCGEDSPVTILQQEDLLYEDQGIVDSAVVTGCYA